jgi:hypothetical protein
MKDCKVICPFRMLDRNAGREVKRASLPKFRSGSLLQEGKIRKEFIALKHRGSDPNFCRRFISLRRHFADEWNNPTVKTDAACVETGSKDNGAQ